MLVPAPTHTTDPALHRQQARKRRRDFAASLSPLERERLEQALAVQFLYGLHGLAGLQNPRCAMTRAPILVSYAAHGPEISGHGIEAALLAKGWQTAFPKVTDGPLALHQIARPNLVPGFRDILEPAPDTPQAPPLHAPDILLVPLVAADLRGNRIGQGGGHYDRTLAHIRQQAQDNGCRPPLAIGLAWDVQVTDPLLAQPWDQPLDALATPTSFHSFARDASAFPLSSSPAKEIL